MGDVIKAATVLGFKFLTDGIMLSVSAKPHLRTGTEHFNAMATQLQHFALTSLLFIVPWLCLCFNFVPTRLARLLHLQTHHYEWAFGLPVIVLGALGLYAMGSVVYGVYTFNDCPQARAELVKEIEEAKRDLRRREVIS